MKVISFVSFKGGAGKTTALMAIASVLAQQGDRLGLFEADENKPLERWRTNARAVGTWDEAACGLYPCRDEEAFEVSLATAEEDGCDYVLIDTAGGGSDLNSALIVNSDIVILPTTLSSIDLLATVDTYQYISKALARRISHRIDARFLLTRFPQSRLKTAEQTNLLAVGPMPQFDNRLTERGAYADLVATGLMGRYHDRLSQAPAHRLLAGHVAVAMSEARDLTSEIVRSL